MVKVIFYNLLRSKYRIDEEYVDSGTIHQIIQNVIDKHKEIDPKDFESAVAFYNNKPIHFKNFNQLILDNETIIFTHFVGGG